METTTTTPMTDEQRKCAANGHQPWVIASYTVADDAWGTQKRRVRYCTGCRMEHPSRRRVSR